MTQTQTSTMSVTARAHTLRPAAYVLFGLLVAAQLAITVFVWWEPPFDGTIRYADIEPISGAYWPMNVLLGGPGYAIGAVTAAIFLTVLGAGRGLRLTLAGAVLHLLAGVVFALVITAEVLPFAWAASLMSPEQGREMFALYNDHFDAFLPYVLGSMAVSALGALLALTGVAVSGGLSWWVPAAALFVVVAVFALPLGSPLILQTCPGGGRSDWSRRAGWRALWRCGPVVSALS